MENTNKKQDRLRKVHALITAPMPVHLREKKNELLKQIKAFNSECKRVGKQQMKDCEALQECIAETKYKTRFATYRDESLAGAIFINNPQPMIMRVKGQFGDARDPSGVDCLELATLSGEINHSQFIIAFRSMRPEDHGVVPPPRICVSRQIMPWWEQERVKTDV